MNNKIEVSSFDMCLLLQFGYSPYSQPIKTVEVSPSWKFDVINYVEMNVQDGIEIIEVINNLPFSEPMRCHNPVFGMQLLNEEKQVFVCSICWQCNSIFVLNNGNQEGQTFDGQSKEDQKLLDKFKLAFNARIDLEDA